MIESDRAVSLSSVEDSNASEIDSEKVFQAFERPEWYLQGTEYNIRIRAETVMAFVNENRFTSILDVGCGNGSLSLPLLKADNHLTLLDQSKAMLGIARSRIPPQFGSRVVSINADFMDARLSHERFDLIICVGVFAYIQRRREFIYKIRKLLRPGGSVIVECTDGTHFISRLIVMYHALRRWAKANQMRTVVRSSTELVRIFESVDFELYGSYRYSLPLPVMRKLMTQNLTYKAIRFLFGTPRCSRNARLGNECIYHFKLSNTKISSRISA